LLRQTQINSFERADALGKRNGIEDGIRGFAGKAKKCSVSLLAQQTIRAPRAALGQDQHDIAHKRLQFG
jgi:hypothetical protein